MTDDLTHYFALRRARTMAALGLPLLACGPAPTTVTTLPETTNTADREPGPPPVADTSGLRCGPDQLREIACTEQRGASCAGTLAARAETYIRRIDVTASERPYTLDSVLTTDVTALEPARPKCCFVRCEPLTVAASAPMPKAKSPGMGVRTRCIAMPDQPSSFPVPNAPKCPAALALPGAREIVPFDKTMVSAEDPTKRPPSWIAERCCYSELTSIVGVGRPYRVGGERVLPSLLSDTRHIEADSRVVTHWREVARGEHASVLAFEALALQLEHVGAPESLVQQARRAARQEETHAQMAYDWVAALTGEAIVPEPLELSWAPQSLRELALDALRDGCFEEGLGAAVAHHLADVVKDPKLGSMLERIATDEAEHAELSWRIIAFAIEREPALLRELEMELEGIECDGPIGATSEALEEAGVPAERTMRLVGRRVVDEWLSPCLRAARQQETTATTSR